MRRLPLAPGLTALVGAFVIVPAAPAAAAANATRQGDVVIVTTTGNEREVIEVLRSGDSVDVVMRTGTISAGPGCLGSTTSATCGAWDTLVEVRIDGGAGDDALSVLVPFADATPPTSRLTGGEGNDALVGGAGDSTLDGGPGDDVLGGELPCCDDPIEAGNDTLLGGPGSDRLVPGEGNDALDGGADSDTGDYRHPLRGVGTPTPVVRVDADLVAGTATAHGSDTLVSIENLLGGRSRDRLKGDEGPNVIKGGSGLDRLRGRGGADRLKGGPGRDRMNGGEDADLLEARDGARDRVNGGPDRDEASVDEEDVVRNVEVLT